MRAWSEGVTEGEELVVSLREEEEREEREEKRRRKGKGWLMIFSAVFLLLTRTRNYSILIA